MYKRINNNRINNSYLILSMPKVSAKYIDTVINSTQNANISSYSESS